MRHRSTSWSSFFLFALGLFSETKVFFLGCVAISELVVFALAPIVFLRNLHNLRRDGFLGCIYMVFGLMLALFVSSWYNHTAMPFVVKSFAVMYGVFSFVVVFYSLLKDNLAGLKWLMIGAALSLIITIFAFNPTAQVSESGYGYIGATSAEDVIAGPLFWVSRLNAFVRIPIIGWYYQMPLAYSVIVPFAYVAFVAVTTISGRSASLAMLAGVFIIAWGRKKRSSMRMIGKHFFLFVFLGGILALMAKEAYKYAALHDLMGEDARNKYEAQTRKGGGILALLMSGRTEFFTAIPAAIDNPIMGYGPHPEDTNEYALRYCVKYGDYNDIQAYMYRRQIAMQMGYRMEIPSHSQIMGAWIHYGVFGLIFYLYYLGLIVVHLRRYSAAIPQWYGYFALMIPTNLWNLFFSAFGGRWQFALFITTLLFARAIGTGRRILPYEMEMEARKYDE